MNNSIEEIKCAIQNPLRNLDNKAEWINKIMNERTIYFAEWLRDNINQEQYSKWTKGEIKTFELLEIYNNKTPA